MKTLAFALLLVCAPALSITNHPDGSVTLTKEEAANLTENFQSMASDKEQYAKDRARATEVLQDLLKQMEALKNRKCL
jgi:hypothetical protein